MVKQGGLTLCSYISNDKLLEVLDSNFASLNPSEYAYRQLQVSCQVKVEASRLR